MAGAGAPAFLTNRAVTPHEELNEEELGGVRGDDILEGAPQ